MLPIGELMRREIAVVSPGAPVRRVVEVMAGAGVEGVLVVDELGRVIGSVGDDQLVAGLHASRSRAWWGRLIADGDEAQAQERLSSQVAADVMLRHVVAVDPTTPATTALRLFDEYGVNVMPVIDHGMLVGAAFRSDLVKRLLLPHLFGRPAET